MPLRIAYTRETIFTRWISVKNFILNGVGNTVEITDINARSYAGVDYRVWSTNWVLGPFIPNPGVPEELERSDAAERYFRSSEGSRVFVSKLEDAPRRFVS